MELDFDMTKLNTEENQRLKEIIREFISHKLKSGVNQQEIAKVLGVSQTTVSNYLSPEKHQNPRYSLEKIADALGIYPEELLARVKGRPDPASVDDLTLVELQELRNQVERRIKRILKP